MSEESTLKAEPAPAPAASSESAKSGIQVWQILLIVAVAAVVAFYPVLENGLSAGGSRLLSQPTHPLSSIERMPNPLVAMSELWSTNYWGDQDESATLQHTYRPLASTLFGLQIIFGQVPEPVDFQGDYIPDDYEGMGAFHFVSLLLYAGLAAAAAALAFAWTRNAWIALAAGILFAVHPAHTEAIGDLAHRGLLLAGLLGFLGLRIHALATSFSGMVAGGALVGASYLAHEFAPGFILMAVVVDSVLRSDGGSARTEVMKRMPFYLAALGVTLLVAVLRFAMVDGLFPESAWISGLTNPMLSPDASLVDQLVGAVGNYGRMWQLSLLPTGLSLDYSAGAIETRDTGALLIGLIAVIGPIILGVAFRKQAPLILAGALMANLFFLLPSNLVFAAEAMFADNFLLVPSLGVVLVVLGLLSVFVKKSAVLAVVAGVLALPAVGSDWSRITEFDNFNTHVDAVVADTTVSGQIKSANAIFLAASRATAAPGGTDLAIDGLKLAISVYPDHLYAQTLLANLYTQLGQQQTEPEEAQRYFALAGEVYVERAHTAYKDFGGESPLFGTAIFKVRESFGSHSQNLPLALEVLQGFNAAGIESSWLDLYLADCLTALGDTTTAELHLSKALQGDAAAVAHLMMASHHRRQGAFAEGYAEATQITKDDPDTWQRAQFMLASWEFEDGKYADAVKRYRDLTGASMLDTYQRNEARAFLSEALVAQSDEFVTSDPNRARLLRREARAAAEEMLRQVPNHNRAIVALAVLGNLSEGEGNLEAALEHYETMLTANADNVHVLVRIMETAHRLKKFDRAYSAGNKAAQLDAEMLDPLMTLIAAATSAGELDQAMYWLEEYKARAGVAGAPLPDRLDYLLARAHYQVGYALENGERDDTLTVEATPESRADAAHGEFQKANDLVQGVMAKTGRTPEYLRESALIRGALGDATGGLQDLKDAIKILDAREAEGRPRNKAMRTRIQQMMKQFEKAIERGDKPVADPQDESEVEGG